MLSTDMQFPYPTFIHQCAV